MTLLLLLLACDSTDPNRPVDGDIQLLAIGDSYLEWNAWEGASIPDVVGAELGRSVDNRAISGTQLLEGAERIPNQYQPGGFGWLIVTGGGNDLGNQCLCGDCGDVLDALISADGASGAAVALVDRAVADGSRVAWLGYMDVPEEADDFQGCQVWLPQLAERMTALADSRPEMVFVDGRSVGDVANRDLYDDDLVHPSVQGSAALGRALADAILASE